MYSPTLEELINSVVAEGKLSPTAETLLRKRAEKEGEDPDEVIFITQSRIGAQSSEAGNNTPSNEPAATTSSENANGLPTYVCPNCGKTTTNSENCEHCGSLLVRFAARHIDLSKTSYLNNDEVFPGLIDELEKNLKLQAQNPNGTLISTDVIAKDSDGDRILVAIEGTIAASKFTWSDGSLRSMGSDEVGLNFSVSDFIKTYSPDNNVEEKRRNQKKDKELKAFQSLPSYPLFTSHDMSGYIPLPGFKLSGPEFAINFGKDATGTARLVSEFLIKVMGLKLTDEFEIFTNIGDDAIGDARRAWEESHESNITKAEDVHSYVCPNCGKTTTNSENCEHCGSMLVRFPARNIDISKTSYLSDDYVFPGLVNELKKNLKLQAENPEGTRICTNIMCYDAYGQEELCFIYAYTSLRDTHKSDKLGLTLMWAFRKYHDKKKAARNKIDAKKLEIFKSLPSFPLYTQDSTDVPDLVGEDGWYDKDFHIDFGTDVVGAARLISEYMIKVDGIQLTDDYIEEKGFTFTGDIMICTNIGNDIDYAIKAWRKNFGAKLKSQHPKKTTSGTAGVAETKKKRQMGIFPGLINKLKENLKLQEQNPEGTLVCTGIYFHDNMGNPLNVEIFGTIAATELYWQDDSKQAMGNNEIGLTIRIDLSKIEYTGDDDSVVKYNNKIDEYLSIFKSLPTFPLWTSHYGSSTGYKGSQFVGYEFAINYGTDVTGAARLISEYLIKVCGLKLSDQIYIFTEVGKDNIIKAREAGIDATEPVVEGKKSDWSWVWWAIGIGALLAFFL